MLVSLVSRSTSVTVPKAGVKTSRTVETLPCSSSQSGEPRTCSVFTVGQFIIQNLANREVMIRNNNNYNSLSCGTEMHVQSMQCISVYNIALCSQLKITGENPS